MDRWNDEMTRRQYINTCTTCGKDIHLHFEGMQDHYFDQVPHTDEQFEVQESVFATPNPTTPED